MKAFVCNEEVVAAMPLPEYVIALRDLYEGLGCYLFCQAPV